MIPSGHYVTTALIPLLPLKPFALLSSWVYIVPNVISFPRFNKLWLRIIFQNDWLSHTLLIGS